MQPKIFILESLISITFIFNLILKYAAQILDWILTLFGLYIDVFWFLDLNYFWTILTSTISNFISLPKSKKMKVYEIDIVMSIIITISHLLVFILKSES